MPGPLLTGKHLLAVYVEGRTCPAPTALQWQTAAAEGSRPIPTILPREAARKMMLPGSL